MIIISAGNARAARPADERNKRDIFRNRTRSTKCVSEINHMQVDNVKLNVWFDSTEWQILKETRKLILIL